MSTKYIDFDMDYTTGRISFPTMTDAKNAERFIKAGPELLEALENLMQFHPDYKKGSNAIAKARQ